MSNKLDMLRQASEGTFTDLYVDNKPKGMETTQQPQPVEVVSEIANIKEETKGTKMLSFRLPLDLIDKLEKYRFVAREYKQDVIIKALDNFLSSKDATEIIAEYDKLKG